MTKEEISERKVYITRNIGRYRKNNFVVSHYFLAQGGVNTQELITDLGTIHLGGLEEHRQPIQDMDVDGYLEQQRTETVLKIIEAGRHEVYKFFCVCV